MRFLNYRQSNFKECFLTFIASINYAQTCTEPNGLYNIPGQRTGGMHTVHIEKEGRNVWINIGTPNNTSWDYRDYTENLQVDIITDTKWAQVRAFTMTQYSIDTDIELRWMAHGSRNPSEVYFHSGARFGIPGTSTGRTELKLVDGVRVACNSSSLKDDHKCGLNGLPPLYTTSQESLVLKEVRMLPRSGVPQGHWQRNRFTLIGTRYFVKIKLLRCPDIEGNST